MQNMFYFRGAKMADIFKLIERLDKVKSRGNNKWLACCPAHQDRSPSLAIKHVDDKILLHCFAGCSVQEVVESIGLTLADLMPDQPLNKNTPRPKFNKFELFDKLRFEATILYVAISELLNSKSLSDVDVLRVEQARNTILDINREVKS